MPCWRETKPVGACAWLLAHSQCSGCSRWTPIVEVLFGSVSVSVLQSSVRDQKKLLVENSKLKKDIEELRIQLQDKQRRRTRTLNLRQNNVHISKRERIWLENNWVENPVFFSFSDRAFFSSPKTPIITATTPANQLVSPTGQTDGSLLGPAPHSSQVKESGRRRGQRKGDAHKAGGDKLDGSEQRASLFLHCALQLVPAQIQSPWRQNHVLTCHDWTCGWDEFFAFGATLCLQCSRCRKLMWERAPPGPSLAG